MTEFSKLYKNWKIARKIPLSALLWFFVFVFILGLLSGFFHKQLTDAILDKLIDSAVYFVIIPISILSYGYSIFLIFKMLRMIKSAPILSDEMCEFQNELNGEWLIMLIYLILWLPDSIFRSFSKFPNDLFVFSSFIIFGFYPIIRNYYNKLIRRPKDEIGDLILYKTGFFAVFFMVPIIGFTMIAATYGPDFVRGFLSSLDENLTISILKFSLFALGVSCFLGHAIARRSFYGWEYPE